jgi:hypothetical protein
MLLFKTEPLRLLVTPLINCASDSIGSVGAAAFDAADAAFDSELAPAAAWLAASVSP